MKWASKNHTIRNEVIIEKNEVIIVLRNKKSSINCLFTLTAYMDNNIKTNSLVKLGVCVFCVRESDVIPHKTDSNT